MSGDGEEDADRPCSSATVAATSKWRSSTVSSSTRPSLGHGPGGATGAAGAAGAAASAGASAAAVAAASAAFRADLREELAAVHHRLESLSEQMQMCLANTAAFSQPGADSRSLHAGPPGAAQSRPARQARLAPFRRLRLVRPPNPAEPCLPADDVQGQLAGGGTDDWSAQSFTVDSSFSEPKAESERQPARPTPRRRSMSSPVHEAEPLPQQKMGASEGSSDAAEGTLSAAARPHHRFRPDSTKSMMSVELALRDLPGFIQRVRPRSKLSKQIWSFLEDPQCVTGGRAFTRLMSLGILVSVIVPVLQTVDPPPLEQHAVVRLDVVLDAIFTVETIIRFATCPNRLVFCLSPYNMIDIVTGLLTLVLRLMTTVSVVELGSGGSSAVMSILFAVPVLRLMKLLRRFETFHLIMKAFREVSEALPMLLFILAVIVLTFSSLIYVLEPRSNIESVPLALWMTIVTVGTIGYGDVVPQSTAGSVAVAALIIVAALYMAIPIGILGKAFASVWDDRHRLMLMYRARNRFLARGYTAADIPVMFQSFDVDGDGHISFKEFLAMMSKLQLELDCERVLELFQTFDGDGSGEIDSEEFVRTLFPSDYLEIYGTLSGQVAAAVVATRQSVSKLAESSTPMMFKRSSEHDQVSHDREESQEQLGEQGGENSEEFQNLDGLTCWKSQADA